MKKGVDGGYGKGISIETRVEKITPMMRRLVRPYFRVGIILSVCLSLCLSVLFVCGGTMLENLSVRFYRK